MKYVFSLCDYFFFVDDSAFWLRCEIENDDIDNRVIRNMSMGEKFYANKSINYACADGKNEVPHQNSAQCSFISCNDRLSVFYHAIMLYCRVFLPPPLLLLSSSSSSLFCFSLLSFGAQSERRFCVNVDRFLPTMR